MKCHAGVEFPSGKPCPKCNAGLGEVCWPGINADLAELTKLRAENERLEKENFALAANQCHAGYGDDYGNHRCEKIDGLKDALLGLIEAVELDSDEGGKGISGYTAARLTDARTVVSNGASKP